MFGAEASMELQYFNPSGLTITMICLHADGMWFDPRGVLWIQTDDGAVY